eukprot:4090533-Amphidinium_carterae.1
MNDQYQTPFLYVCMEVLHEIAEWLLLRRRRWRRKRKRKKWTLTSSAEQTDNPWELAPKTALCRFFMSCAAATDVCVPSARPSAQATVRSWRLLIETGAVTLRAIIALTQTLVVLQLEYCPDVCSCSSRLLTVVAVVTCEASLLWQFVDAEIEQLCAEHRQAHEDWTEEPFRDDVSLCLASPSHHEEQRRGGFPVLLGASRVTVLPHRVQLAVLVSPATHVNSAQRLLANARNSVVTGPRQG